MDEIAALVGLGIFVAWVFAPMISILRSPATSGSEKMLWAAGTFLPFALAIACAKVLQWLAPTRAFAVEILGSGIAAFLFVMFLLAGGWGVKLIYRIVMEQRAQGGGGPKQRAALSVSNLVRWLFLDI